MSPRDLVRTLLNREASFDDRKHAALDLGACDEAEVEFALARIAADPWESTFLTDSCVDALAEIWIRKRRVNKELLLSLTPESLEAAHNTMRALRPSLAAEMIQMLCADRLHQGKLH